jgi:hypothetical protein
MAVHFVYRCHYAGPAGKHVAHFPDDSVLAWFQNHWAHLADPNFADERLEALLGFRVYGLASLFEAAAEHQLPPPSSQARLVQYLNRYLYVEGAVECKPHLIQALTDDDEISLAYFFFDDHFLARHADRAAFLLHEGWQLPGGAGGPGFVPQTKTQPVRLGGKGEGTVYAVLLSVYASDHMDDMTSYRFEKMRLGDLARGLAAGRPDDRWPFELVALRAQLFAPLQGCVAAEEAFLAELRQAGPDETPWRIYSDFLIDLGQPPAGQTVLRRALERLTLYAPRGLHDEIPHEALRGDIGPARAAIDAYAAGSKRRDHDPALSRVHAEEHLAQLCLHADRQEWHQWYFFDDLWASAHPALAEALLVYGRRWDVLSSPRTRPPG